MRERFGPGAYGHDPADMFTDIRSGTINYEYFKPYFDEVGLDVELARLCIGDDYRPTLPGATRSARLDAARFIRLSTLRGCGCLPPYREVKDELVPYGDIGDFTVARPLSIWGGDNMLATTPCVFVSHRWLSAEHPDPSGGHLDALARRFADGGGWNADEEVYLWIDFCCLPQRHGSTPLTSEEHDLVRSALEQLPELVKSCELLILHTPDYLTRAWCYTELFVWLGKIAEIRQGSGGVPDSRLVHADFRGGGMLVDTMVRFVSARGFDGRRDDLVAVHEIVNDYYHTALDSASYNMGAYSHEYIPDLVAFTCTTWHELQEMDATDDDDKRHCLRAIVKAVKM